MQRLSNQICHKFEWFEWQCLGKRVFNFIKNNNNKSQPNQSEKKMNKLKQKHDKNNNKKIQITHTNSQNMIMLLESILPCITRFSLIVYSINKENN